MCTIVGVPGLPRLIEAAWLVAPETPSGEHPTYLMLVRLRQEIDQPHGWTIDLRKCQRSEGRAERWYATETDARTVLVAIYKLGEQIGIWRRTHPSLPPELSNEARPTASTRSRRTKARHR